MSAGLRANTNRGIVCVLSGNKQNKQGNISVKGIKDINDSPKLVYVYIADNDCGTLAIQI